MNYFKLQLGCLLVVLYITVIYVKETLHNKIPCNKFFDLLLYITPWGLFFDGLTAWTVNHMDIVPAPVNLCLHAIFLILMEIDMIAIFIYMYTFIFSVPDKKRTLVYYCIPGFILILLTAATLPKLYYIYGNKTNYSMGLPVIFTYLCVLLYSTATFIQILVFRKQIDSHKRFSVITFYVITMCILIVQILVPESLISALFSTFVILGIYITSQDPFFTRISKYNQTLVTDFATMVESRDNSTGGHVKRTQSYVHIIIDEMKKYPKYKKCLTKDYRENLIQAAPLHDVGKISTPDHILQKPGKLTFEEYEIMKLHAAKGGEIINQMLKDLDMPEFEKIASEVANYHHEKWNGKGYPKGLAGEEIPLHSRIMAVADVFDAVSAKRCYRDAMPIDKCFKIIEEGRGLDFDPEIVDIFLNAKDKVLEIYNDSNFTEDNI